MTPSFFSDSRYKYRQQARPAVSSRFISSRRRDGPATCTPYFASQTIPTQSLSYIWHHQIKKKLHDLTRSLLWFRFPPFIMHLNSFLIMHLPNARSPIHFIAIIILVATFQISLTTSLPSPSAEDSIFSSQDLIFPNDVPSSLFLDSNTPSSDLAISYTGVNEEEPLMSIFSNDDSQITADALDADANLNNDLLSLVPLDTGCQSAANTQAEIGPSDLSSSSLWTRDESKTCPNPSENQPAQQQLDIPSTPDLFQGLRSWFPKNPNPTNLDLGRGIRLPPPSALLGGGNEGCFFPHPLHCCCDGARAFSGRTVGGLIRVVTIEGCDAGMKFPFFWVSFFLFHHHWFFFGFFDFLIPLSAIILLRQEPHLSFLRIVYTHTHTQSHTYKHNTNS